MPGQFCKIDRDVRCEEEINGVAGWIARVGHDLRDLFALGNEAFAKQKSSGKLFVVARGAHGDADGARFDLDFERLFGGDGIVDLMLSAAGPVEHLSVFRTWRACVFAICAPATHCQDEIKGRIKTKSKSGVLPEEA